MEKPRSGKRGTDTERIQNTDSVIDCERVSLRGDAQGTHNSSNNSAQVNNNSNNSSIVNSEETKDDDDNNSHPLVSTVVTRSGFRSSTIAKRACVSTINTRNSSLHNNKSDRFSSNLNDIRQRVTRRSSTNNNSRISLEQIQKGDGNGVNKEGGGNEEALKSVIKTEKEVEGQEEGKINNDVVSDEIEKQVEESPLNNNSLKNPTVISKQNSSSAINNALEKGADESNTQDKNESTDNNNHLDSVVVKIDPDQLEEQKVEEGEKEEEEKGKEQGMKRGNDSSIMAGEFNSSNNSSQEEASSTPIKSEKSITPCSSPSVSDPVQIAIGLCISPPTTTGPRSSKSSSKSGKTSMNNNSNNNTPALKKNNGNVNIPEKNRVTPTNNFMNNLPYMGELTFDTRPRRGRKPKKADICHLISKNYGIQFPNSYVNIPSSSPTPCVPPITVTPVTSGHNKSVKNKSTTLSARNSRNSNNNNCNSSPSSSKLNNTLNATSTSSSNNNNMKINVSNLNDNTQTNLNNLLNPGFLPQIPINWNNQLPPDLLPLASLNPAAFLHLKNSMNKKISLLPPPLHFHPQLQQQQQQNQEQLLQQQISRATHERFSPATDEPLNLCVKDQRDSSPLSHVRNLNSLLSTPMRSSGNSNSGGSGKNHLSLSSIYQHHHGKSQGSSTKRGGSSHLHHNNDNNNNSGSVISNKVKNIVSEDPNLVNINLQLNLSASTLANYVNSSINNRPLTSLGSINNNNSFSNNIHTSNNNNSISYNLNSSEFNNNNSSNSKVLGKSSKSRRKRPVYSPIMPGKSSNSTATSSGNSAGSHNSHNYLNSNHGHNPHQSLYDPSRGSSINPMDSSNSPFASSASNPAEVSICKFKFTGGAKPSLQEKKMLSVDSTGNFRFYSDKPCTSTSSKNNGNNKNTSGSHPGLIKEEYSQSGGELVSAHGLPKSAKSMSMCMPVPIPAISTCSMVSDIPSPSLPLPYIMSPATVSGDMDCSSSSDGGHSSMLASPTGESSSHSHPHSSSLHDDIGSIANKMKRKRRTRKSLMREKLEKTFKEKGFLIQTQQVEASEGGATYCKFRQLRKFTRYLFRSWKDYLPDNLKGANQAQNGQIDPSALSGMPPSALSDLSESMDIHDNGNESDAGTGSETPDNLTLSPEHASQYDEQDPLEYEEEEEEDIDET